MSPAFSRYSSRRGSVASPPDHRVRGGDLFRRVGREFAEEEVEPPLYVQGMESGPG